MNAREELSKLILSICKEDGVISTGLAGVRCLKFSNTTPLYFGEWARSFVIVAQGQKEITLLESPRRFGEAHFLATPIDLMVASRVKVSSADKPYLALLLDLDPKRLADVAAQIPPESFERTGVGSVGIYSGPASEKMLQAAVRLLSLAGSTDESEVLAPLAITEIYFHLLKSKSGYFIQQFALAKGEMRKISVAVASLKANLHRELDILAMAKKANMSRTSFFRAFKKHTALSPVQFLKLLRLTEARRLLQLLPQSGESVESVGFAVGYKSASQFSREYSRFFGAPPKQDASNARNLRNKRPR